LSLTAQDNQQHPSYPTNLQKAKSDEWRGMSGPSARDVCFRITQTTEQSRSLQSRVSFSTRRVTHRRREEMNQRKRAHSARYCCRRRCICVWLDLHVHVRWCSFRLYWLAHLLSFKRPLLPVNGDESDGGDCDEHASTLQPAGVTGSRHPRYLICRGPSVRCIGPLQ